MNTLIQMDYSMIFSLVFEGVLLLMVSKWYDVGFIAPLFGYAKAFDVVLHYLLLDKLRLLAICIPLTNWIADLPIGCVPGNVTTKEGGCGTLVTPAHGDNYLESY